LWRAVGLKMTGAPYLKKRRMVRCASWVEIFGKGAHPVQPCEKVLVVVQDWRSELVCGGFDLGRLATAGGVAGWI
jgi:hypothetical protein